MGAVTTILVITLQVINFVGLCFKLQPQESLEIDENLCYKIRLLPKLVFLQKVSKFLRPYDH